MFDWLKRLVGPPEHQKQRSQITDPAKWLLESVTFFRSLGFFSEYETSDEQTAEDLRKQWEEDWGKFDPSDELRDLSLTRFDRSRVWWEDTEADVCEENRVFVATLEEWGAISRGTFHPTNIREKWETPAGPVRIAFDLGGREVILKATRVDESDDYLDLKIIPAINAEIFSSGIQFELYYPFDQTAFIVALTREEKQLLQSERGWRFAVP